MHRTSELQQAATMTHPLPSLAHGLVALDRLPSLDPSPPDAECCWEAWQPVLLKHKRAWCGFTIVTAYVSDDEGGEQGSHFKESDIHETGTCGQMM